MKKLTLFSVLLASVLAVSAAETNPPAWLSRPLSLADTLNTALAQNATILKAKNDLEASHGVVVQTRAVALPQLLASGQYKYTDPNAIEGFLPGSTQPNQNWNAGLQIVQNIYMGGKLVAAIRAADATKQQAVAVYRTAVADTLLQVRLAYYDVLLAAQQITVREASVKLLQKELEDQHHRYDAGTVPHFNVLRAEVAVANERPALIQARNNYRITKNNLANLLGYDLPRDIWEDVPLNLTDTLDTAPFAVNLPDAIQQALASRTELTVARKSIELHKLNVVSAKAGYQPTVSVFAGYDWFNAKFTAPVELDHDIRGWNAGAQLNWNIFDGALTAGKVTQAKALYQKSQTDLVDQSRQIELAVRTAYSEFIQARETLESQAKVQEQADEALREANARAEAGTGTQLDVLDAETSLTQARTTQIQAQHDYVAARARLERAIGADLAPAK
jgi:outer membrane protein TolC